MNQKRIRLLVILLVALMLVCVLSLTVSAEEEEGLTGITGIALTFDGTIEPHTGVSTYLNTAKLRVSSVTATVNGEPVATSWKDAILMDAGSCGWKSKNYSNIGNNLWTYQGGITSHSYTFTEALLYRLEIYFIPLKPNELPFDISTPSNFTLNGQEAADVKLYANGRLSVYFDFKGDLLPKAATPTGVTFQVTGADTGLFSNVSDSMAYRIGDGELIDITSDTAIVTGLNQKGYLYVVQKGDGVNTSDSDPQKFFVFKKDPPRNVTMTPCTTAENNDGRLSNLSYCEVKIDDGEWQSDVFALSNLSAGTVVSVRTPNNNTHIASDVLVYTIPAVQIITEFDVTYDGDFEPTIGESTHRPASGFVIEEEGMKHSDKLSYPYWSYKNDEDKWAHYKKLYSNDAADIFEAGKIYRLGISFQAYDGFLFDSESVEKYTFNGMSPDEYIVSESRTYVYLFYYFLPKQAMPTATFNATGDASGVLSNVNAGMKYSVDGGETWTLIDSTSVEIASGITLENGIKVYALGVEEESLDSDIQTITVTKGAVPETVAATACTTADNNDGKLTGVNSTMEYKADEGEWTAITGNEVTGLVPATYYVRAKASGMVLPSDETSFIIAPSGKKAGEVSVTLTESFKMNFYVDLSEEELARAKVVYTFIGKTYEDIPAATGFSFDGIAPQYLGETLNAKLYIDEFLAYEAECSIKTYLEIVTAAYPDNETLQTLAKDILVYGGAAQKYMDYKTSELVSEGVTGTTFVPLDEEAATLYGLENNGSYVKFTGATLHFDDMISLKVKFQKTTEEPLDMHCDGDDIDYVEDGEEYVITIPIKARKIWGSVYSIYVNESEGASLIYDVGNYVGAMQDRDDTMGELARALWNYGIAAQAYFAS